MITKRFVELGMEAVSSTRDQLGAYPRVEAGQMGEDADSAAHWPEIVATSSRSCPPRRPQWRDAQSFFGFIPGLR
jgi:hypothetical protein